MTEPINFQDPIETIFKKIEDGVCYASAGMQPYMEAQYVNIAFLLILNTGAIPDACRDWQRRTPVNQKWDDFQREFARAQREQRIISRNVRGAGYHTANFAEHYGNNSFPAERRFVTAMANLATVTSSDREKVATLNKEIATLTEQLKAKDIWAKSQEAELKRLLGGHVSATSIVPTAPSTSYVRKSYKTKNDNYCWSHGYQVGLGWLIQVQIAPRSQKTTGIHPPRTISWEVILGEANSFDNVGTFR
jgi:hypothetical protein